MNVCVHVCANVNLKSDGVNIDNISKQTVKLLMKDRWMGKRRGVRKSTVG